MPFISKDWRSPGEEWVKYDGGWERKSIIIDPNPNLNFGFDLIQPAAASIATTAAIQIHNKANFNVEICEQQKPKTSVAEAVATTVVVTRYHCLSSSQPTVIILFRTVRPG